VTQSGGEDVERGGLLGGDRDGRREELRSCAQREEEWERERECE